MALQPPQGDHTPLASRWQAAQDGASAGQSVITTTDLAAVPGADAADTTRLAVAEGVVLSEAEAHAA